MDDTERSITWRGRRIPYSIRRHRKSIYAHVSVLEGVVCWYAAASHEFVSGKSIAYLGRSYLLKVLPGETGRIELKHRCLEVPVKTETRHAVRAAIASWFRGKAEERLPGRVEAWHEAVGIPMPPVVISDQRKRVATCDRDGAVRLNWRLVDGTRVLP